MELKMKDILVTTELVVSSNLKDFEEAFKDMTYQPEFLEQHKEGDKYAMDYCSGYWALLKVI